MNKRLLTYIDNFLYQSSADPLQQLVYMIARLSLVSSPVAWVVKRPGIAEDKLFISHKDALMYLDTLGNKDDYVDPLFPVVKIDMNERSIRHLLLTPSPYEE